VATFFLAREGDGCFMTFSFPAGSDVLLSFPGHGANGGGM